MSKTVLCTKLVVALLLAVAASAVELPGQRTRQLVAVLQSDAPLFDKARACQQLGEFGDTSAVPALATMLSDTNLAAYARSGLEGIAGPAAAEALRSAIPNLHGPQRAGVIDSLGTLRDEEAVECLIELSRNSPEETSSAALRALGRIASGPAVAYLRGFLLSATSSTARAEAASGCLLAAEHLRATGRKDAALAIYNFLRDTPLPSPYRVAATQGAIRTKGSGDVSVLIECLRSGDRALCAAALQSIRFVPSPELAAALNAELGAAAPELKVLLITALADCHNKASIDLLRAAAAGDESEARCAALRILGSIGGAGEVDILLAAANGTDKAASDIAMDSLARLEDEGVDAKLTSALGMTRAAPAFIRLARLAEIRRIVQTTPTLLERAKDPDTEVAFTALRALKKLGAPESLPDLLAVIHGAPNGSVRDAAGSAYVAICARTDAAGDGSALLMKALAGETDPAMRRSALGILAALGTSEGLSALEHALHDSDETVAACAARELARWKDPAPIEMLLARAEANGPDSVRRVSLASAIALATQAAESKQHSPEKLLKWLTRCARGAQSASERLQVISGLVHVSRAESLRLLLPYLDDAATRDAAALAIARMGPTVSTGDADFLNTCIERSLAFVSDPATHGAATDFIASLPVSSNRAPLFNGQTLAGWEGNTSVWRVQDGTIVGGSLNGNARNEFLATTRSYTNFVLQLEYRLAGTQGFINGGVQLHSTRIAQPPNEMSGYQADLGAGYTGALYDESRRNKVLARPAAALIKRIEKPNDWNRYEMRCADGHIEIFLNGERTVDYREADASIPQRGLIALQIHGGSKAEISFRRLSIRELPSL